VFHTMALVTRWLVIAVVSGVQRLLDIITVKINTVKGQGVSSQNMSCTTLVIASNPFSIIQAELENYLLLQPLGLNQETVKWEFRDVIYNADVNPGIIRQELEVLDRDYFVQVLSLQDNLMPAEIQDLASHLEEVRAEVFSTVQAAETQGKPKANRIVQRLQRTRDQVLSLVKIYKETSNDNRNCADRSEW
jgi:hypothetical protein